MTVAVVGVLPPGGVAQARSLVKRLRAALPEARIVVGRWCVREDMEATRESLLAAGADEVATSLLETRDVIMRCARVAEVAPDRAA